MFSKNQILSALSAELYGRIAVHLSQVTLEQGTIVHSPGEPLTQLLSYPSHCLEIVEWFISMDQPCQRLRWIFVLEPDNDARAALRDNLPTWGYAVVMALDEADAIERSQQSQKQFGLILLNQCDASIEAMLALGNQIRQAARLDPHTPILILAEQYGEELEEQDVQLGNDEYLSYLQDGEQLKQILQRLCSV